MFLQSLCGSAHSILVKPFLTYEKLDKTFYVRCLPLKIALCVICRPDIWIQKQLSGFFVWPIVGYCVLLFGILLYCFNNSFKAPMFSN